MSSLRIWLLCAIYIYTCYEHSYMRRCSIKTGCFMAALWSWRYLTPLSAEMFAYHKPSTCWLHDLNWCTLVQVHYFVKDRLKFLSLPNIIGAKRPPAIPSLALGSRTVTVSFEEYNSIAQLLMGQCVHGHLTRTCDHVIIELEPWLREPSISSLYPVGYLNAKRLLVRWINSWYIVV